jgi:hypothetical protein
MKSYVLVIKATIRCWPKSGIYIGRLPLINGYQVLLCTSEMAPLSLPLIIIVYQWDGATVAAFNYGHGEGGAILLVRNRTW